MPTQSAARRAEHAGIARHLRARGRRGRRAREGRTANAASACRWRPRATRAVGDYVALTKPRLNLLVVATSAAGYYLGAAGATRAAGDGAAVAGTALVAGGAAVLNQVYERDTDALMRRTRHASAARRPRRRRPTRACSASSLSVAGLALLAACAQLAAAALALATLVDVSRRLHADEAADAARDAGRRGPGALPPLIGWTASHGSVSAGGAALFAIVFLWQIPHFMAIAWLYRDDYGRAGFRCCR